MKRAVASILFGAGVFGVWWGFRQDVGSFTWMFAAASLVLAAVAMVCPANSVYRAIAIVGASVVAAASLTEYVWTPDAQNAAGVRFHGEGYPPYRIDDQFGYRPLPDTITRVRKLNGSTVIYDVSYTIGAHGFRVTPQAAIGPRGPCVWTFGDSFAFGEGVDDHETLAARLAAFSPRGSRLMNFGIHGWGAHQMLVGIQSGVFDEAAMCDQVSSGVYLAISDHVRRAAGLASWDWHGPNFVLNDNGTLVHEGPFFETTYGRSLTESALNHLERSQIYSRLLGRKRPVRSSDLRRYAAIVRSASDEFRARHAGASFHVVYWDGLPGPEDQSVLSALEGVGIKPVLVSRQLPASSDPTDPYLFPGDGHPTPLAHDRLAAALGPML